ncbi:hypothetical protein CLV79_11226 [Limimaricola soesokkakensis]|uniref:Integral membrane protein TerC family protein n=1 Tax=Limimaricola soesokkakensis TaxID=1343159 RepID=A0A1X6ZYR6_9RHOB|nr:DUF475 domain-containing protein [Limimaricola soesokkakensis]PSK82510.1 hypothetical protein CLV79_11226 [Limimaricola soesokkakensis]SLN65510.1 Integral membrane protein TerC family protein [Limimaricola soesokkakensis]
MRAAIGRYFAWSFGVTILGLVLAVWLGWRQGGAAGALSFGIIATVLAVLEISLSFDNAIVNANKLDTMSEVWRRRFLTWGILIAVFGMRIVFPLAVVVVAAGVGPWEAVRLAAAEPAEYARIMEEAHLSITAFGGTFLMMVALSFFIDESKEVDWFGSLERRLRRAAGVQGLQIGLVLVVLVSFAVVLDPVDTGTFLFSALLGLLSFLALDMLGNWLDAEEEVGAAARAGGLGAFLYLEVLDASFSFDGVIGAFAVTKNLFLIAIGLGIGAMYVRSMTIMLVEKRTLAEFRYLEHGAFYSILVLSVLMFAQTLVHVPEAITGLLGAALIGVALWSSIRHNRAQEIREA